MKILFVDRFSQFYVTLRFLLYHVDIILFGVRVLYILRNAILFVLIGLKSFLFYKRKEICGKLRLGRFRAKEI